MDIVPKTNTASSSRLLDINGMISHPCVTIMRDSTDAGDGIPFSFHLMRSILATKKIQPCQILLLTTRTRTNFINTTTTNSTSHHIHPVLSRDVIASLSTCQAIDPYLHLFTSQPHIDITINQDKHQQQATNQMCDLIYKHYQNSLNTTPRVVLIECLHALKFSFSIDPPAFIRTLTTPPFCLSVVVSAPVACGVDHDILNISTIAENVVELSDLRTGVAIDIDGMISVTKRNGTWAAKNQARRYKITPSSFNISS